MRAALNTVTMKRGMDPLQAIKVTAAAGFSGIGLWWDALKEHRDQHGSLADVKQALNDGGLRAEEICFTGGWMWAEGEARKQTFDDARLRAEMAAEVGAPCVIACASGGKGDPEKAAADFRALCDVGQEFGVAMALEYIGAFEQYHDVKSGLGLVRAAEHPYGKLLIDIFHSFRGGTVAADFKLPKGDEVGLVHINDVPAGDIMQMNDSHRVLPGEGVLPLKEVLANLAAGGYEGALSVEIFNEAIWALPVEEVAKKAREAMGRVLSA